MAEGAAEGASEAATPGAAEAASEAAAEAASEAASEGAREPAGRKAANPVRRLYATVLACEAIVIALAIPVAISVLDVSGTTAGAVCGGLAVLCLLMAGLLRFPWSFALGSVLQVAIIATGFMVPAMFFLGVLFGALWLTAFWMGRKVERLPAR